MTRQSDGSYTPSVFLCVDGTIDKTPIVIRTIAPVGKQTKSRFRDDAERLLDAIVDYLPGGTVDELIDLMLEYRERINHPDPSARLSVPAPALPWQVMTR